MTLDEIRCGEGERLGFKRALLKDDVKWLKTVVAFANGRGGRMIFGVDSDLTVTGMADDLFGAKDAIADAIANRITPMPPISLGITTLEGKPIVVLDVAQGMQCPYYLTAKGDTEDVFIRYDATTRQADETILRELRIAGVGKSFDKQVCRGLSVSERDIEKLCRRMRTVARHNAKTDEQRKAALPICERRIRRRSAAFSLASCPLRIRSASTMSSGTRMAGSSTFSSAKSVGRGLRPRRRFLLRFWCAEDFRFWRGNGTIRR